MELELEIKKISDVTKMKRFKITMITFKQYPFRNLIKAFLINKHFSVAICSAENSISKVVDLTNMA